jgi:carbon storage regulator CsrA
VGEAILLDGGIRVEVVEIDEHGRVLLGITAPAAVGVVREELVSVGQRTKARDKGV